MRLTNRRLIALGIGLLTVTLTVVGLVVPTGTAKASTTTNFLVTLYGWPDNSPPGNAIAYPADGGYPTIHNAAGGTGTYANPVTFATDQAELPERQRRVDVTRCHRRHLYLQRQRQRVLDRLAGLIRAASATRRPGAARQWDAPASPHEEPLLAMASLTAVRMTDAAAPRAQSSKVWERVMIRHWRAEPKVC
jgi:hypothetical protein